MFKDRDVICFLGDSITAEGLWEAEVYQTLRKKYKIKCYNCGVSGSIADKVRGYMHTECLIHNPDYVVLMLGMNDMNVDLYKTAAPQSHEEAEARESWFLRHKGAYEEIIHSCKNAGAEVIICLPTPYDEVSEAGTEKKCYQAALERACAFQLEMAEKYGCRVVNFKDHLLPLLGKAEIIQPDRTHPTDYGYHVMAQIFLKEIGEIAECDFDTPFVFEDWNKKRYDAEKKNKKLNYVELCTTYFEGYALGKSADEIKEIARERLRAFEPGDNSFIPSAFREYIECGHLRTRNKGEVVRLTIF